MNYKCPFRERGVFCTNKYVEAPGTSNGKKYCGYSNPLKCAYFMDYYNSLSEQEKSLVMAGNSPRKVKMARGKKI